MRQEKREAQPDGSERLLTFAEAADALGIVLEQVRLLAIEEGTLGVVWVDAAGRQSPADPGQIREILAGEEFLRHKLVDPDDAPFMVLFRVDSAGRLLDPVFATDDTGKIIAIRGHTHRGQHLRITSTEVQRYRDAAAAASNSAPPPYLTSPQMVEAFGGIVHSRERLAEILRSGRPAWVRQHPVVKDAGTAAGRASRGHMRDPVEFAKRLLQENAATLSVIDMDRAFSGRPALSAWRETWERSKRTTTH